MHVHQWGKLAQCVLQFPLFLKECFSECLDLAVGDLQFISLVLLELFDHRLVVQDEFFYLNILILIVDLPLRDS
jgi:hypothetical protein